MGNFAVMWPVNRATLDMAKWNNDMFVLQMTWQFLIPEDIRICGPHTSVVLVF